MSSPPSEGASLFLVHSATQLAPLLRSLRKAKSLTQADLGAMLGVSGARISAIEQDPGTVSVAQFLRILQALGARMSLDGGAPGAGATPASATPKGEW